jgi:hypothetical protein
LRQSRLRLPGRHSLLGRKQIALAGARRES